VTRQDRDDSANKCPSTRSPKNPKGGAVGTPPLRAAPANVRRGGGVVGRAEWNVARLAGRLVYYLRARLSWSRWVLSYRRPGTARYCSSRALPYFFNPLGIPNIYHLLVGLRGCIRNRASCTLHCTPSRLRPFVFRLPLSPCASACRSPTALRFRCFAVLLSNRAGGRARVVV
jgi:hypothetical protein